MKGKIDANFEVDRPLVTSRDKIENLKQKIISFNPEDFDKDINILIIGLAQTGKTSVLNSINSILNGRYQQTGEAGGNSANHGTVTFRKAMFANEKKMRVKFWDMQGLDQHLEFFFLILKQVVTEGLPEGYKFDVTRPVYELMSSLARDPRDKIKVHGILFVASADKIEDESNREQLATIKKYINELVGLHITYYHIITKLDQKTITPTMFYTHPYSLYLLYEYSRIMSLNANEIYAFNNYISNYTQDFNNDRQILEAISLLLPPALTFAKKNNI